MGYCNIYTILFLPYIDIYMCLYTTLILKKVNTLHN